MLKSLKFFNVCRGEQVYIKEDTTDGSKKSSLEHSDDSVTKGNNDRYDERHESLQMRMFNHNSLIMDAEYMIHDHYMFDKFVQEYLVDTMIDVWSDYP